MNIHRCYTLCNLVLTAVLTVGFGSSALAQELALLVDLNSKEVTALGTLDGDYSGAYGINDAGQVVGSSYSNTEGSHAFITGPDGAGITNLGTLGGVGSEARGINDVGQVIGDSGTASGQYHAFITGPDGLGMTDLGTLGGDYSGHLGSTMRDKW